MIQPSFRVLLIQVRQDRHGAPVSTHRQMGESPIRADALRPVTDCNCVAARQGGEQQEVNDQPAGYELDSARCASEPAVSW